MNEGEEGSPKVSKARQRFHDLFIVKRIRRGTGEEIHPDDWRSYQKAKKLEEEGKVKPIPGESPKGRALRLIEDVLEEPSEDLRRDE